jgi:hypothetical protein
MNHRLRQLCRFDPHFIKYPDNTILAASFGIACVRVGEDGIAGRFCEEVE